MSLNEIIFDHIDDKYAYGKYSDFKVIIMKENRYINATKLCKEYGKELSNWKQNKGSNELIDEVEKEITALGNTGSVNNAFIIVNTSNKNEKNKLISGTYVHELLIPHIASWISPQFGIKVSKIVNNFLVNEYKNSLKEKDNKINTLEDKLDKILKTNNELLNKNDEILAENKDMKKILEANQIKLDKTFDKLVGAHEEIRDIKDKLDNATDDRVVKPKDKSTLEYLIILKTDDPDEIYKYYCIRCQKRAIPQRLAEKENYYEIKRIGYTPNSINLYNRIKEKLGNNLDRRNNRFNIKDISEQRFLRRIDKINEERKVI
jgi:hypothetical protein